MPYLVPLMISPDKEEAVKNVRSLLEEISISSANLLDPVSPLFWWQKNRWEKRVSGFLEVPQKYL